MKSCHGGIYFKAALGLLAALFLGGCVILGPKPSELLDLGIRETSPGRVADVTGTSPTARNTGLFTVPEGKVFVATSISVLPSQPGAGKIKGRLIQRRDGGSAARDLWVVSNSGATQLEFPSGIVIGSGYSLHVENMDESAGPAIVWINGHLAEDE